jgi:hypothetical protein
MEPNVIVPLIAGFVGILVGAISSVAVIFIQQRYQSKREKMKLASEMALEDYKVHVELLKSRGGSILPISVYQYFHYEILSSLENGSLDAEKMVQLRDQNRDIEKAIRESEGS